MPKQPHDHTSATAGANLLTILDQEIEARDCDPTGASRAGEMQEAREAVADLLAALDGRVPGDPHSLARVQWLDALLGVSRPGRLREVLARGPGRDGRNHPSLPRARTPCSHSAHARRSHPLGRRHPPSLATTRGQPDMTPPATQPIARSGTDNAASLAGKIYCELCSCRLDGAQGEDLARRLCRECRARPEARRPMAAHAPSIAPASAFARTDIGPTHAQHAVPRVFTEVERALITKLHGFMPAQSLLKLLNERLRGDLGPGAPEYTIEQLHNHVQKIAVPSVAGGGWADLRKRLAHARRSGVLDQVNAQVIDDFAVVYALSAAQVLRLKDVVLSAKDPGDEP